MRLSESEISNGLLHDNVIVREEVFKYFTRTGRVQPDITRKVIQAINQFGWKEVFRWSYQIRSFTLDETRLPWAMEQIQRSDDGSPSDNIRHHLADMVSSSPIEVLRSHRDEILANEFFHRQLSVRTNLPTPAATIERRLELHELSAEACWNELLTHCQTVAPVESFQDANIPKCKILIGRIVEDRAFSDSRHSDIRELLSKTSLPNDPSEWLIGLMVMLAGRLQMPDTIALLYRHYEVDWDWYNEEITKSLTQIGTEEVHQYVAERYISEPWYIRNYAHGVFEDVYSASVQALVSSLLEKEHDDDLRGNLGVAAASHFDDAGIDIARSVFLETPDDPDRQTIIERLVAHSHLTELDLPERDQWERQIVQDWEDFEQQTSTLNFRQPKAIRLPQGLTNPIHTVAETTNRIDESHTKLRRNSLCPCGSGKKYKKCCLRKSTF